jgi:hypothetical protein
MSNIFFLNLISKFNPDASINLPAARNYLSGDHRGSVFENVTTKRHLSCLAHRVRNSTAPDCANSSLINFGAPDRVGQLASIVAIAVVAYLRCT